MYALDLNSDNRIVQMVLAQHDTPQEMPRVNTMPDGSCIDYLYVDGAYVHDPLPSPPSPTPQPSALDLVEAQVAYTAMMTDTLLPTGAARTAAEGESEGDGNA